MAETTDLVLCIHICAAPLKPPSTFVEPVATPRRFHPERASLFRAPAQALRSAGLFGWRSWRRRPSVAAPDIPAATGLAPLGSSANPGHETGSNRRRPIDRVWQNTRS